MIPIVAETRERFQEICRMYKIPRKRAQFTPVRKFLANNGIGETPDAFIDYDDDSALSRT